MYLCCDFVAEGYTTTGRQLPILQQLHFKNDGEIRQNNIETSLPLTKPIWLPTTRKVLDEIRLYISKPDGSTASFDDCKLYCSLGFAGDT